MIRLLSTLFIFTVSPVFSVPSDSIKEDSVPSLFLAIQKEDVKLYSKEMKNLLNSPVKDAFKTIQFKTKEGNNIFHLMAGVRSHQEFFVEEMKSLADVFLMEKTSGIPGIESANLSLGGVDMFSHLEETELGQAIMDKNIGAILSMINRLDKIPAIEVLKTLNARSKNGESLQSFAIDHLGISKLMDIDDRTRLRSKLARYTDSNIPRLLVEKNNEALSPKDIIYKTGNKLAYTEISYRVDRVKQSTGGPTLAEGLDILIVMAGTVLGAYLGIEFFDIPSVVEVLQTFKTEYGVTTEAELVQIFKEKYGITTEAELTREIQKGINASQVLVGLGSSILGTGVGVGIAVVKSKCHKVFQQKKFDSLKSENK